MKTYKFYKSPVILLIIVVFMSFYNCKQEIEPYKITKYVENKHTGLATAHPEATRIGMEVLEAGGNAVDAAIAVQFALAVCYPIAGNIGGGGFMIYRNNKGEVTSLDFRETAPMKATEKMYQDSSGNIIEGMSIDGIHAAGVPGTVDGMVKMYEKYSKLKDWKVLIQPSIDLAKNGFKLTKKQAKNLQNKQAKFRELNSAYRNPLYSEKSYKMGDIMIQEDLGRTLEAIRDHGRAGFYEGAFAQKLISFMEENDSAITQEDLDNYTAIWRDPIVFDYKNYTIYSMGPPSSGGIILAQLFHAIEEYPISEWGFHDERAIHLIIEAEKRAYADRATHMGDADFYDVPVKMLTSKSYSKNRMKNFHADVASNAKDILAGEVYESEETTHFSIVDKYGNAVSLTTTLNGAYGSKSIVPDAGYILNNEMDDFSTKVGFPNLYGLVGGEANKIEPGKRMLSSMTPTIVCKNDSLYMVVGTPGGSTIITSVFQTIINSIEYNMNANDAIQSCRFHHQWKPEDVFYEENCLDENTLNSLQDKGHSMKSRSNIGRMECIISTKEGLQIAADKRGDDDAGGW